MKAPFIVHPRTGEPDPMLTMACITVAVCTFKFLLEGISFVIGGHPISFGHADAMTYGALLTPVLGAHATREWKIPQRSKVDDPDAAS